MPRFTAFACDYDETLARQGRVPARALAALERLSSSGRKLLLVTGRELPELVAVFAELRTFDAVVAENGAVLHLPATGETRLLAEKIPRRFIAELAARRVAPLSAGEVIVATREPNEEVVLETIRQLGLELQLIFNKGGVMVLPPGINKGSGLTHALHQLGLSRHNCVAVGDAENDHAFLGISGCAVAVANALPTLKERADLVTSQEASDGVIQVIEQLLADDLRSLEPRLSRHHLCLGEDERGSPVRLRGYDPLVLLLKAHRAEASPLAAGLMEQMTQQGYQYCLVDSNDSYETGSGAICIGTRSRPPSGEEVLQNLSNPDSSCRINLVALPPTRAAPFFTELLFALKELRARTGRPGWILADEANCLVASDRAAWSELRAELHSTVLITGDPERMAGDVLLSVGEVLASASARPAIERFAQAVGAAAPFGAARLQEEEAVLWAPGVAPLRLRLPFSGSHPGAGERPLLRQSTGAGRPIGGT